MILLLAPALAGDPTLAGNPAACGGADFRGSALAAETAFAAIDPDALARAIADAERALACLDAAIDPRDAAAFHRVLAMDAFVRHDFATALVEFHAARRLEPGYTIPESVAPAGHPLVSLYDASARSDEGELQPVHGGSGFVLVDGVRNAPRPTGVSVVLQRFDALGRQEAAMLLRAHEPLPGWAVPPPAVSRKGLHAGLLGGTAAATVTGAVLYGLALDANRRFWDLEDPSPDSELPGLRAEANTLGYASIGAGVVALALGTVTVVTW